MQEQDTGASSCASILCRMIHMLFDFFFPISFCIIIAFMLLWHVMGVVVLLSNSIALICYRYLEVCRQKELTLSVREGVDTLLMYLYRALNCISDMEKLASSTNSCIVVCDIYLYARIYFVYPLFVS